MKAALLGYGKMGRLIEKLAAEQGIEIVEKYWDEHPLEPDETNRRILNDVDVLIDFSVPGAAVDNIRKCIALGKNVVIGTTGWQDRIDEVRDSLLKSGLGMVYASNYSLGVNLFYKLAEFASEKFALFQEYAPFIEESHHQFKKDAPSGTALEIQNLAEKAYGGPTIPVTSVRAGFIPGTHSLSFDSKVDTVKLTHTARNREGFAAGALLAAKWIAGRKGIYHFREVLDEWMQEQIKK